MPNATTDAILDNARAALPGVADDVIKQTLFTVCDDLAREALMVAAPVDIDADPATWLPVDQWVPNFQPLLAGVLAYLYGQFGKPYFQPDLAKANLEKYLAYRTLSRTSAVVAVSSSYDRLISTMQARIPAAREHTLALELYNTVNDVRTEALRLAALPPGSTNPDSWLTDEQWELAYLSMLHGTLARLFSQSGMPWYSAEASAAEEARYQTELQQIRADYSETQVADPGGMAGRIIANVQSVIPIIRIEVVKFALFNVINDYRAEVLRTSQMTSGSTNPASWLTEDEYKLAETTLIAGVFAAVYAQTAMPWGSLDNAKLFNDRYQSELQQARSQVISTGLVTIPDRIIANVQATLPLVRAEAITLELFNAVNKLRVEAYRYAPLAGTATSPASWLTADEYQQAELALLHAVLSRLYTQNGTPWYNLETAKVEFDLAQAEQWALRGDIAGSDTWTDSIAERLVATIRAQIQLVRPSQVKLEMFGVINKLRAEVYQLPALTGADVLPTSWLTEQQYTDCYLTILYGTLSRLYGQSNMPWYNLDQFGANNVLFQQELDLVRSQNIEPDGPIGGLDGIIEEARAHLPGARDEVMRMELRRALDEFFKTTQTWTEAITFKAKPGKLVYELSPSCPAQIVRLVTVLNPDQIKVGYFSMLNIPQLVLACDPGQEQKYTATVVLSLWMTGACGNCGKPVNSCSCGCNTWNVPGWIVERWNEVIFNGLLWRMMMQPGKPYTNTELGVFHGQRWRGGCADARGATLQHNVYDAQNWRFPAFA